MTTLSIVCAMAHNRVIGRANTMPWHLPVDLQHFKQLTLGKVIIMGRATYESIGRPLPGRTTVVLSRQSLLIEGVTCFTSLEAALAAYADEEEIMIVGGAQVYAQSIDLCSRLYLTLIDLALEGDRYFPAFSESDWQIEHDMAYQTDPDTGIRYKFVEYVRKA